MFLNDTSSEQRVFVKGLEFHQKKLIHKKTMFHARYKRIPYKILSSISNNLSVKGFPAIVSFSGSAKSLNILKKFM